MDKPKPDKQAVRKYITERTKNHEPVPSIEEIRRQLGWKLIGRPKRK